MAEGMLLFGGTFDPVHNGHLIVARAAAEELGFARVTLIPANNPPHKPPACAPAADRLAMLGLAVQGDGLFDVCDLELRRSGPSYTLDTLKALRRQLGEVSLHWLIGADMLADLPDWHRADEVLSLVRIVVAARPAERGTVDDVLAGLSGRLGEQHIRRLREGILHMPLIDISSSDIRRRVAAGQSVRYLVPEGVARYVADHGLYRQADPPRQSAPRRCGG